MLVTILIVSIAFGYLLKETNFLRLRLPCGKIQTENKILMLNAAKVETILALPEGRPEFNPVERPYSWKTQEEINEHMELCRNNYRCPYKSKCDKVERWTHWEIPARTIKAFGYTMNFGKGCNYYRAYMLKEVVAAQKRKPSQATLRFPAIPLMTQRQSAKRVS